MGINMYTDMKDIMKHFNLCIIKSSTEKLKDVKASLIQTLKTTQDHGGMNIILERRYDQKQFQCELCEFRANQKCDISNHKRRIHTDYKVLCDRCGYTTNDLGHLKRHVKAKHAKYVL